MEASIGCVPGEKRTTRLVLLLLDIRRFKDINEYPTGNRGGRSTVEVRRRSLCGRPPLPQQF